MSRILICDDHRMFAEALMTILQADGMDVAIATSPGEAVAVSRSFHPDVCVMDLHFPGNVDGAEAARQLKEQESETQILLLSASLDHASVRRAVAAGAAGFARKDQRVDEIRLAVNRLLAGEVVIDPQLLRSAVSEPRPRESEVRRLAKFLTPREREVLQRLVQGQSARTMAEQMHVSYSTARTHIQSVLSKLGVHSRLEAAAFAVANRLIDIEETG